MTLCEPVITTRQSTRHGHRNKIITNSQNMYICENSPFFTVSNPLWTHMFIISSILTIAEGGSNDIYDGHETVNLSYVSLSDELW